eukprot:TRINITY_DN26301_c1_g1_i1.p1 TRINITY_DN26301_c1_g1~~TRINITY_DN26301_c1_g1_i1.p1  ORF type:complete len:338 (+),score=103.43 TRINITY_DN26301_c1_g1_i1:82-1095(+)
MARGRSSRCLQLCVLGVAAAVVCPFLSAKLGFVSVGGGSPAVQRHTADVAALGAAAGLLPTAWAQAADGVAAGPLETFGPAAAGVLLVGGILAALRSGGPESGENVDDKKVVEEYFNGTGFERWQKIYGETDDINPVQMDIRNGHAETVKKILKWSDDFDLSGRTVCDAGCGTGSLSIPLAARGALVSGSDISAAMAGEAAKRAEVALKDAPKVKELPKFKTLDLEALSGEYDCVCCVDVLIHYPPERVEAMVEGLAKLSKDRVILSFAPKTWYYTLLKSIGEFFPGKSKTTRAYLHPEEVVEASLKKAGFEITRKEMTATNFYFSRLFEARATAAS